MAAKQKTQKATGAQQPLTNEEKRKPWKPPSARLKNSSAKAAL